MIRIVSFGLSAFMVFLAVVQSSSSKPETPARIQNRDTVAGLYGHPVSEVYRTSQDLTVTASFSPNGNLCRARVQSGSGEITDARLNGVLDELAPKDVRGKFKIDTFLNGTCLKLVKPEDSKSNAGGKPAMDLAVDPCVVCSGVSEEYERVNITRYGNTNQYSSVWITFHRPECQGLDKANAHSH